MPDIARQVGRGFREFKRVQNHLKAELRDVVSEFDSADDTKETGTPVPAATGDPVPGFPTATSATAFDTTDDLPAAQTPARATASETAARADDTPRRGRPPAGGGRVRRPPRWRCRLPRSPSRRPSRRPRTPDPPVVKLPKFRRPQRDPEGRMSLADHLGELRHRLMVSILAVVIAATMVFVFAPSIIHWLIQFYNDSAPKGTPQKFIFTGPLDAFATRLKIATYGGIVLAMPVWLWELWRFITPGLNPKEKKYAVPFILSSIALFALGRRGGVAHPAARAGVPPRHRRRRPAAAAHRRQVHLARRADDPGVRARVRVPDDPHVPADRPRDQHAAAAEVAADARS